MKENDAANIREAIHNTILFAIGVLLAAIVYRIVFWPVNTVILQVLEIWEPLSFWEGSMGRDFELFHLILSAVLILFAAPAVPLKRNIAFPLLCTIYSAIHLLHGFHDGVEYKFDAKLLMLGAALSVLFLARDRRLEPAGFAAAFIAFGAARYLGCPVAQLDLDSILMTPFGLLMAYMPVCLLGLVFDLPLVKEILTGLSPKWSIPIYLVLTVIKWAAGFAVDLILLPYCLLKKLASSRPSQRT